MRGANPIRNKLERQFGKRPPNISDESIPYEDDPMVYGSERGYERNWKQFSHSPFSPKVKIRRQRGISAKHPI